MNKEILECYISVIPAMELVDMSHKHLRVDLFRCLSLCRQGFHALK